MCHAVLHVEVVTSVPKGQGSCQAAGPSLQQGGAGSSWTPGVTLLGVEARAEAVPGAFPVPPAPFLARNAEGREMPG